MTSAGGSDSSGWAQRPSHLYVPEYVSTTGQEALEVCELAGIKLDAVQGQILTHALGELPNGKWAAFEVGYVEPRQNGKTMLSIARELVGLFLLGERLIVHTAHLADTSFESFRALVQIIEETPDFDSEVKRIVNANGKEGIELKSGQRIRYRARTKGGGRGWTGDCLILDEAMILAEVAIGALMPTLSARPNPQIWYLASAVDQDVHEEGLVLARLRERAIRGNAGKLFFVEFGLDYDHPDEVPEEVAKDPEAWKKANHSYEDRISADHIKAEQESMDARTFAVERLGVGDWPNPLEAKLRPISPSQWQTCFDPYSEPSGPLFLDFDVSPRHSAAIAIAGYNQDHKCHVEVIDHRPGTGWVVERIKRVVDKHNIETVFTDGIGPGVALIPDLEELGIEVVKINTAEHAAACEMLYNSVVDQTLAHLGTPELQSAIAGAIKRPLGDRWAWHRLNSSVDICPLVAITMAQWGLRSTEDSVPQVWSVREAVDRLRAEREGVEPDEEKPNTTTPGWSPGPVKQGWVPL